MSYVRFMNGTNPIWDFIAEMGGQEQGREREHSGRRHRGGPPGGPWAFQAGPHGSWDSDEAAAEHSPWSQGMPHRPRHGHGHGHGPPGRHGRGGRHHGPPPPGPPGPPGPPPPPGSGDNPPPPPPEYSDDRSTTVQAGGGLINLIDNDDEVPAPDPEISAPVDDGAYSSGEDHPRRGCRGRRNWNRDQQSHPFGRHHGRGGMRGPWGGPRGSWDPTGMPWGPPPHHHHPYHPHGHQRHGSGPPPPPGAGGPFAPFAQMFGLDAASFDPERLREAFAEALQNAASSVHPHGNRGGADVTRTNDETSDEDKTSGKRDTADFRPAADIYDAADAYIVHFALPGAKKEDISLNWDAEKSELNVAGVIAREGDEEVMKTLALNERDVGVFERRVKLGREGVEAEGISAKMENGLLVVRVPKKAAEDEWTEVMKVDIE